LTYPISTKLNILFKECIVCIASPCNDFGKAQDMSSSW